MSQRKLFNRNVGRRTNGHLERIRKRLIRLPPQITKAYSARAAVVIPLCRFQGEPSVLFTLRSLTVGKHKGEVCFRDQTPFVLRLIMGLQLTWCFSCYTMILDLT
ncbi:unnamed protein product [Peronospora farinosa]|uniref:Uncharacterized protein n=1 Tax=Peronospora farinosa TaxID=134698 RepID=A0AAV0SPX0_9STRA|nr:unnamed protein product [Peronospora farinosa]CAI5704877.1 unnamed protein product [Peronospora farinosa]